MFDLECVGVFLIREASPLLVSLSLGIHIIGALVKTIVLLLRLPSEILELIASVNNEIINQNTIESNYVVLNFSQPLLVNIALKTVLVIILLKHFQVFLSQASWNSLEVWDVLIYLHDQFVLFICFLLFINGCIFSQNLLMHSTG